METIAHRPPARPDANARPHVEVRGLTKRFGSFAALKNVSLDVWQGEFICFLGPSGCGKTTLLRAIAGLDPQSEGTIAIGGRDVSHAPPSARDFGIVFQSYALFPNLTVADNVGYGLVNRRMPKSDIARRVADLLAMVGLADQGAKYPVQLSGGQQQRVALARALATSPGLLLLDEPLSALDAKVRVRLRDEIKEVQRRLGVTTIMVTHDQEEALSMADRIVVMNHGVIEQVGTAEEIYRNPATAFVADFVGHMTFLDAVVSAKDRVNFGELEFHVTDTLGLSAGAPVRLAMRPEEVRVRGLDSATQNRFEARVEDMAFLGAFCRAQLSPIAAQGNRLAADFSTNAMRDLNIVLGQTLNVAFPPSDLRLFPEELNDGDDRDRRRGSAAGDRPRTRRRSSRRLSDCAVAVFDGRRSVVGPVRQERAERQRRVHRPCELHPLFRHADALRFRRKQCLCVGACHRDCRAARLRLRLCADAYDDAGTIRFPRHRAPADLCAVAPAGDLADLSLRQSGSSERRLGGASIYGPLGIVIAQVIYCFPHALTILITALSLADARLYEAADALGTTKRRTFLTVTLPGARYGIISACFVVFTLVITDFEVAKVIGGQFNMLATDVYKQVMGQQNFQMGAVVGLILLMPAILAFVV